MFGITPSARLFTKTLAYVIRFLRSTFFILIQGYIDDFLIQAATAALCLLHTHVAIIIFHVLGFEVNFAKSALSPSQSISHLGFDWDSSRMTIALPTKKVEKIRVEKVRKADNEKEGCEDPQKEEKVKWWKE